MIRIFTTGGTIDKVYFDAKSEYEVGSPNIIHALKDIKLSVTYRVTPLMEKDSLDMTDEDRALVKKYVEDAITALLAGKSPVETMKRAIGCTIKWKES